MYEHYHKNTKAKGDLREMNPDRVIMLREIAKG